MILLTIPAGKSGHYMFITFKLMPEVSMSIILSFQKNVMILSLLMTFIMILLTNLSLIVFIINNLYNDKDLNVIMKSLKSIFQYSLSDCVQFSEELKLLNDYFKNYKTDTDFNENALN